MHDAKAKPQTRRPRVFYGWWMAISGLGMSFYTDGVGHYGFSVFFDQIIRAFPQWPLWALAIGPSLARIQSGVLAPITGYMVDRVGPRKVLLIGFPVAGLAFMLLSGIQSFWQYYPIFLLRAVGLSAGSFVIATAAVSNWFSRKRGRAISVVMLGPGLSGLLVVLWAWMVPLLGWRTTLFIAGLGFWIFCIPLASVMRRKPEEYGLRMDGDDDTEAAEGAGQRTRDVVYPMGIILRSRGYWQYVAALALADMAQTIILFQIPAMTNIDIPLGAAGLIVLWLTISSLPSRLLSGVLSDLFDKRKVLAGAIVLQAVAVLVFAVATNVWMVLLYATLMGTSTGLRNPARLALQAEYWGRSVFGRLSGIQMGVSSVPGILSPVLIGWMVYVTGNYRFAFIFLALVTAVAVPFVLAIKGPEESAPMPFTGVRGGSATPSGPPEDGEQFKG